MTPFAEPLHPELAAARAHLREHDFVLLRGAHLGVPADFDRQVHARIFPLTELDLRYNPAANRGRAREVLRYDRTPDGVLLRPHPDIAIVNRNDTIARHYKRVPASTYPPLLRWVAGCLALVPEERRDARGTFALNYFRTRTCVVTDRHRDHEAFIVVQVVHLNGRGARTQLFRDGSDTPCVEVELTPGDCLVFRDAPFTHFTTPIQPIDEAPLRDALVCTVNYPTTYALEDE